MLSSSNLSMVLRDCQKCIFFYQFMNKMEFKWNFIIINLIIKMFKSPKKNQNYDGLYPGQSVGQFLKRKQQHQLSQKINNLSSAKSAKIQEFQTLETAAKPPKTSRSRWQQQHQSQLSKNLISAFSIEKYQKNKVINGRFAHKLNKEPQEKSKQKTIMNFQQFRNRNAVKTQFNNLNQQIEQLENGVNNITSTVYKIYLEGKMVFGYAKQKAQNQYITKLAEELGQRLRKLQFFSKQLNKNKINPQKIEKTIMLHIDTIEAELKRQFEDKLLKQNHQLKSSYQAKIKAIEQLHKSAQHSNNVSQRKIYKLQQKLDQLLESKQQKIEEHKQQLLKSAAMYEKQINEKNQTIQYLKKTLKQNNDENAVAIKKIKDQYFRLQSQRQRMFKEAKSQWQRKQEYFLEEMRRMKSTFQQMDAQNFKKCQIYQKQIENLSVKLYAGEILIANLHNRVGNNQDHFQQQIMPKKLFYY